jgi:hypothetical protein
MYVHINSKLGTKKMKPKCKNLKGDQSATQTNPF